MPTSQINLQAQIIKKIIAGKVKMKPKWYFFLGTACLIAGTFFTLIATVFLVSLASFFLRQHGPMGQMRFTQLLDRFPWWAIIAILISFVAGYYLIKRFDFSYRPNFQVIMAAILFSIIIFGILINYLGLDRIWMHRGWMKCLYADNCGREKNGKSAGYQYRN